MRKTRSWQAHLAKSFGCQAPNHFGQAWRSESIMLEIDICPFLASIISRMYGNLHCSSCGIWWYLKLNASWGQSSRTSVLSVFNKMFLRFEPVVEPVSWMMESRRNLEADLLDFLICTRKVKKRLSRTILMCVILLNGSIKYLWIFK